MNNTKHLSDNELDSYERKMAKFTPADIWSMSDEEALGCANLIIEGDPVPGVALNGVYFNSTKEAVMVAKAVVNRAHYIYNQDPDNFAEKLEAAYRKLGAIEARKNTSLSKEKRWQRHFGLLLTVFLSAVQ